MQKPRYASARQFADTRRSHGLNSIFNIIIVGASYSATKRYRGFVIHLLAISRGARCEAEPVLSLGTYLMECNGLRVILRTGTSSKTAASASHIPRFVLKYALCVLRILTMSASIIHNDMQRTIHARFSFQILHN